VKFIRPTIVRRYVNSRGKKVSRQFLNQLDVVMQRVIDRALKAHNGGRKTLDGELVEFCLTRVI
jgi:hypothetical protein